MHVSVQHTLQVIIQISKKNVHRGVYTKPLLHSSLTFVRVHVWIQPIEGTTQCQEVSWGADTGFISWQELEAGSR